MDKKIPIIISASLYISNLLALMGLLVKANLVIAGYILYSQTLTYFVLALLRRRIIVGAGLNAVEEVWIGMKAMLASFFVIVFMVILAANYESFHVVMFCKSLPFGIAYGLWGYKLFVAPLDDKG